MRSYARIALAVGFALVGIQATAEAQDKPKASRNRDKLETDEIRAVPSTNVYQLIKSKRPHWLTIRGLGTMQTRTAMAADYETTTLPLAQEIMVYMDNARYGSHESLRNLQTDEIDSLEYLNANAATQRFGTGHGYGAIIVRRRVTN